MRSLVLVMTSLCAFVMATQTARASVTIAIDLSGQRMHVTGGAGESYDWPISTARSGYVTPRGYFRPQRLERMHYSRKYDMSPMPHSIFFHGGYAIHGTGSVSQLGRPASHGCIRLAPGNAARLYSMVQHEGARISISGSPPRGLYPTAVRHQASPALRYRAPRVYDWYEYPDSNWR